MDLNVRHVILSFKMVTAGGDAGAISNAKSMITNVIIGFIILLAAYLIVDTVMKILVGDKLTGFGPWNEIQCVDQPEVTPIQPATNQCATAVDPQACECEAKGGIWNLTTGQCDGGIVSTDICADDTALMTKYKGSPVGVEDPELIKMKNCYLANSQIASAVDSGQIYTVDRTAPRCSLTNGYKVCGLSCQHSVNSCHYGRGGGTGARAVDFNAKGGSLANETALFELIKSMQAQCGGKPALETQSNAIHTHISMTGC
jgi:hypothetical protein